MAEADEFWFYASEDGEVRFVEEWPPSLWIEEPYIPEEIVWNPTAPTLEEMAESVTLTYATRRYKLQRIRFRSVAGRDQVVRYLRDSTERLKRFWQSLQPK